MDSGTMRRTIGIKIDAAFRVEIQYRNVQPILFIL